MAWFWQQKKEEKEKAAAQKKSAAKKQGLVKSSGSVNSKKVSKKNVTKAGKSTKSKRRLKPEQTGEAYKILLGPIITEKTARLAEEGTYVFAVAREANKISIARAVKIVYGVDPIKVTKSKIAGKKKIFSQRRGRRVDVHKAFVSLKSGQSIELFEKV